MAIKETFLPLSSGAAESENPANPLEITSHRCRECLPPALNWDQLYNQLDSQKHRTSIPVLASRQECFVVFREDLCLAGKNSLRHTTRYSTARNTSQSHHVISYFRETRVNKKKTFSAATAQNSKLSLT